MEQNCNKTLGVFDSGLGGLTVLRHVLQCGGYDRVIYFGDTARMPYGGRNRDELLRFAWQDADFLLQKGADEILVACGTVSAVALPQLQAELPCPVRGIIKPTVRRAARCSKNGVVGVIGTQAAIASGAYRAALQRIDPEIRVVAMPCPLLVPAIEYDLCSEALLQPLWGRYLAPLRDAGMDTLILGCTHYPLLRRSIETYLGDNVTLVEPGEAIAAEYKGAGANHPDPKLECYTSGPAGTFACRALHYAGVNLPGIVQTAPF